MPTASPGTIRTNHANVAADVQIAAPLVQFVRDRLDYDPVTGAFKHRSGKRRGKAAGSINGHGYVHIKLDGKTYRANRLAWMHFYGVEPTGLVDHRNRVRSDNRIENLRDIGAIENLHNGNLRATNTSGFKGVSQIKNHQRWVAGLKVRNARYYGPWRDTPSEAARDYDALVIHHLGDAATTNASLGLLPSGVA